MAITYVASATELGDDVASMPTHAAGDLLVIAAFNLGPSAITLPAGWTNAINANGYRVAYKVAASASETSGTWTGSRSTSCSVFRGASRVGAGSTATGSSTQTPVYPALTLSNADGTSWCFRAIFAEHDTVNSPPTVTAPTGYTRRSYAEFDGTDIEFPGNAAAAHDSNAGVTTVSQQNGGASNFLEYRTVSVEILAAGGGALFWAFP